MNEFSLYFHEVCKSAIWADTDESICGCRGSGWWLSEVDTWHKCPFHGHDAPHPEGPHPDEGCEVAPPLPAAEAPSVQEGDILF